MTKHQARMLWQASFEVWSERHAGAEESMTKEKVDALNALKEAYDLKSVDKLDSEGLPFR